MSGPGANLSMRRRWSSTAPLPSAFGGRRGGFRDRLAVLARVGRAVVHTRAGIAHDGLPSAYLSGEKASRGLISWSRADSPARTAGATRFSSSISQPSDNGTERGAGTKRGDPMKGRPH